MAGPTDREIREHAAARRGAVCRSRARSRHRDRSERKLAVAADSVGVAAPSAVDGAHGELRAATTGADIVGRLGPPEDEPVNRCVDHRGDRAAVVCGARDVRLLRHVTDVAGARSDSRSRRTRAAHNGAVAGFAERASCARPAAAHRVRARLQRVGGDPLGHARRPHACRDRGGRTRISG